MKKLVDIIKENVVFKGIYCSELCIYKNFEWCNLFNEETGYNWKKEKAKRLPICIKYFGKNRIKNE